MSSSGGYFSTESEKDKTFRYGFRHNQEVQLDVFGQMMKLKHLEDFSAQDVDAIQKLVTENLKTTLDEDENV